jgi:hypothetical protein
MAAADPKSHEHELVDIERLCNPVSVKSYLRKIIRSMPILSELARGFSHRAQGCPEFVTPTMCRFSTYSHRAIWKAPGANGPPPGPMAALGGSGRAAPKEEVRV